MEEKDEYMEQVLIDEEEAKKLFLEELRNKNLEETREFERALLEKALLEQAKNDEAAKEEEKKALEQVASDVFDDKNDKKEDNKEDAEEINQVKECKKINGNTANILKTTVIDTAVAAVVSVIAVYLFDLLIRLLFGYYVVDFKAVYIIVFIVILILYPVIMQNTKCGKTIGSKFSKTEVKEREE